MQPLYQVLPTEVSFGPSHRKGEGDLNLQVALTALNICWAHTLCLPFYGSLDLWTQVTCTTSKSERFVSSALRKTVFKFQQPFDL